MNIYCYGLQSKYQWNYWQHVHEHNCWVALYYLWSYLNFICVNQVLCHGFQNNCKEEPGMLLGKEKAVRNLFYGKIMIILFFTSCNIIESLSYSVFFESKSIRAMICVRMIYTKVLMVKVNSRHFSFSVISKVFKTRCQFTWDGQLKNSPMQYLSMRFYLFHLSKQN